MAKTKSSDSAHTRVKVFDSTNEISQGIEKLRSKIVQVEELKKDGLPYRDALKVTTEYQIRDTIREVFGAHSPEFHEHQHHRIRVNSKAGVDDTITLLQNLVLALEEKRLHLLGFRPRPAAVAPPEGNGHDTLAQDAPPQPQPPQQTAQTVPAPAAPVQTAEVEAPVPAPPSPAPVVVQHNPSPPAPREAERAASPHPSHSHHTRKGRSSWESRMKEAAPPPPVVSQPVVAVAPPIATVSAGIAPQPVLAPPPPQPQVIPPIPVSAPPPVVAPPPAPEPVAQQATPDAIDVSDQTPVQQHTEMNVEVTMPPTPAPPSEHPRSDMDTVTLIQRICTRFHSVARQLRQRSDDRSTLEVEDEVDVQDVLRAVLCTQFDDIHTETWNPAYANGIPRADLVLKQDGIVIVAKKTKQGVGAKTLTEQLGVDIQRYMNHSLCKTLVCFIYDPEGRIGNPDALEATLVRQRSARRIEVIISPR
jgi:hypothetical protein